MRYHDVLQHKSIDNSASEYRMVFPPPHEARGIEHYINLFEVYDPPRGSAGDYNMEELYRELSMSHEL